jgi:hypothetical protein
MQAIKAQANSFILPTPIPSTASSYGTLRKKYVWSFLQTTEDTKVQRHHHRTELNRPLAQPYRQDSLKVSFTTKVLNTSPAVQSLYSTKADIMTLK